MENLTLSDVFNLPVADRIRLAEAIWESIARQPEDLVLTDSQRAELDQCYEEYRADPGEGAPWSEVKARLLNGA